jgi:hypothetical protein
MRRGLLLLLLLLGLVVLVLACGEIREDEVWCEAAVARLHDCCAGIEPQRFSCVHSSGCNDNTVPTLSQRASQCIVDRSCDALVANGICKRMVEESRLPFVLRDGTLRDSEVCR